MSASTRGMVPNERGDLLPELSRQRRLLVLGICCMSLFIVGLDSTIVNVALPSIGRELHASVSGLQWTIDAYALVLASLLMFSGSTADRIGRRRTFQAGLALFTVGSLLCSLAPGLGWLIAFRMIQVVGGSLVDSVGWRGIFWVNIPVGIAAIVLTALFVPESRAARHRRPDPLAQVLVIVLLASLTYAIIEGPGSGWASAKILFFFGLALVALIGFLAWEPRRDDPLIDPRFFRSAPFSGATATAVTAFAAMGGFLFLNTLYLQDVRGFSPLAAGLYLLPMAVTMAVCALLAGRIVAARGARIPLVIAGLALIAGGLLLTRLTDAAGPGFLAISYVVFGAGFGLVNAPITNAAVSGMPRQQAGVAAGVASTSRQVGTSLGVAVMGSVLSGNLHGPMRTGFVAASQLGWWIVAACGAIIVILGIITTGPWARRTAARTAARLEAGGTPPARSEVTVP